MVAQQFDTVALEELNARRQFAYLPKSGSVGFAVPATRYVLH
jgi:hypothetical protein